MNWKVLEARRSITFDVDEPICMILPHRKGDLEQFVPSSAPIETDPAVATRHRRWAEDRWLFMAARGDSDWQGDYLVGRAAPDIPAGSHRSRLNLREFLPRDEEQ
jgi:hypothetical protein